MLCRAGSGFGQEEGTLHLRTTILPQVCLTLTLSPWLVHADSSSLTKGQGAPPNQSCKAVILCDLFKSNSGSLTRLKTHKQMQEEKIKEVIQLFQGFHKKFMDEYR